MALSLLLKQEGALFELTVFVRTLHRLDKRHAPLCEYSDDDKDLLSDRFAEYIVLLERARAAYEKTIIVHEFEMTAVEAALEG